MAVAGAGAAWMRGPELGDESVQLEVTRVLGGAGSCSSSPQMQARWRVGFRGSGSCAPSGSSACWLAVNDGGGGDSSFSPSSVPALALLLV